MNMVTVKINGIEYKLKGDENEEYLHKVASYVDRKIKNIIGTNSMLSTTAAAVLSAANIVDDLFKCDNAYSELLKKIEELEKNEKTFTHKIEALERQLSELKNENEGLQSRASFNNSDEILKQKDIEIEKLVKELSILQESTKKFLEENSVLKADKKELKFQLQSSKYKIMDLQNKIIENHIDLAKAKNMSNPLIKKPEK